MYTCQSYPTYTFTHPFTHPFLPRHSHPLLRSSIHAHNSTGSGKDSTQVRSSPSRPSVNIPTMSLFRKPNVPSAISTSLPTPASPSISNVSSTASPLVCPPLFFLSSCWSFGIFDPL